MCVPLVCFMHARRERNRKEQGGKGGKKTREWHHPTVSCVLGGLVRERGTDGVTGICPDDSISGLLGNTYIIVINIVAQRGLGWLSRQATRSKPRRGKNNKNNINNKMK